MSVYSEISCNCNIFLENLTIVRIKTATLFHYWHIRMHYFSILIYKYECNTLLMCHQCKCIKPVALVYVSVMKSVALIYVSIVKSVAVLFWPLSKMLHAYKGHNYFMDQTRINLITKYDCKFFYYWNIYECNTFQTDTL